jgi:N-acetylglucosaminyldiphosphoundecaprenol N-acetyl-beta-D-mannosaminyltransferase
MNPFFRDTSLPPRTNVLGVGAHAFDVQSAKAFFLTALKRHRKGYVCFTSVHGVMEAQNDLELRRIYDEALVVAPDGMPLVWVGQAQGFHSMERIAGPEMMLELMGSAEFRGFSHFLCGGEPGMAEELRGKLQQKFPGVNICGVFTPPFRPMKVDEERALVEAVHRVQPDIIWVGLGAPKQERFMAHYLPLLDTTLMMGVGAAFLLHTGRIKDSPRWVKRAGMQWMHRLLQEPTRLWRRYLLRNPSFLLRIGFQFLLEGRNHSVKAGKAATVEGKDLRTAARTM